MTNSSREESRLSLRLQTLQSFFTDQQHIWDIGCDHGLLGKSFQTLPVDSIYLIDPSRSVVEKLLKNFGGSYITKPEIIITQSTGQNLKIHTQNNLIFIAGMGGIEIGQIIDQLLPQLDSTSKIVISPHRKILELRKKLNQLDLVLERELVVHEGGQFYQILSLLAHGKGSRVSLFGDSLWNTEVGGAYRLQQLKYFSAHQDSLSQDYCHFLRSREAEN